MALILLTPLTLFILGNLRKSRCLRQQFENKLCTRYRILLFSHPPKRRMVTYASGIRLASVSVSTLCTSSMKPLHGIISCCTCILVKAVYLVFVKMGGGGSMHPLKNDGGFCLIPSNAFIYITIWQILY